MENSTADQEFASRIAALLVASFPNQPHDPKTFLRQLTILLTGESRSTLKQMADPRNGWLAEERFPTLASASGWLKARRQGGRRESPLLPPPAKEPAMTASERRRRAQILKRLASEMRKIAKANMLRVR